MCVFSIYVDGEFLWGLNVGYAERVEAISGLLSARAVVDARCNMYTASRHSSSSSSSSSSPPQPSSPSQSPVIPQL